MSYGLATTWERVNDQFLFQVNCPFKGKFSRVELRYVLFQVTSAFSNYSGVFPYHIVFPLQQLCIVGDIWLGAPDSYSIWPLWFPIVPTHRSKSDYVIGCLPFCPLTQILTLLLFIISLSFHSLSECMIAVYHLSHRVDFPATYHTTPVQQYTPESSTATVTIWSCFNYPWSLERTLNEI